MLDQAAAMSRTPIVKRLFERIQDAGMCCPAGAPAPDELARPHPGSLPGGIYIDLPTGVRLLIDSYVNEKALARVLREWREAS